MIAAVVVAAVLAGVVGYRMLFPTLPKLPEVSAHIPTGPGNSARPMVWVQSQPDTSGIADPTAFGESYPLYFMQTPGAPADRARVNVADAVAAGVQGLTVNVFTSAPGKLMYWMNPYLTAADRTGLVIAPLVNLATASGRDAEKANLVEENVLDYCATAATHRSAATLDSSLVVFVYSANLLDADGWNSVKRHVTEHGCATKFIMNIPQSVCGDSQSCYAKYLPAMDYGWNFSGLDDADYRTVDRIFTAIGRPYLGGIWPRLFSSSNGVTQYRIRARPADPGATGFFRQQLVTQSATARPWLSITTLDDFSEHTNIDPSSDFGTVLSDITRWYSARYTGAAEPFDTARVYATSPQALYAGQSGTVEGLVLNGSTEPVTVRTEVLDRTGQPVGAPRTTTVGSHQLGAASVSLTCPAGTPAGSWFRGRISTSAQTVLSAPVLCYSAKPPASAFVLYYSVQAGRTLPDVALSLTGDTVGIRTGQSARPAFTEVIHDTRSLFNTFGDPVENAALSSLAGRFHGTLVDNRGDADDHGFYLARVILANGTVGYSDPVYKEPA